MIPERWARALSGELEELARAGNLRGLRCLEPEPGTRVRLDGRTLVNCSSNDYLGLAHDAGLLAEFYATLSPETLVPRFGLGAASSRLLTGNHENYRLLEDALAAAYGRESALVFNSGYHANLGILAALAGPRDAIFSDRLNHASLLDGARLSGAKLFRYNHLDQEHLKALLRKHRSQYRRALLVTESVFSMDGDVANLAGLADLRDGYDLFFYVDEAHAAGVFGDQGLGCCETQKAADRIDLVLGTFGKAWGSAGAYALCDRRVRDYLVNKARPFIFTTGLPPVVVHWNRFVLERMPGWNGRRQKLAGLAGRLRQALQSSGLTTGGESQIVPIVIGSNADTLAAAEALMTEGLLLLPIRPPTVPAGTARLRISLTAAMAWEDVCRIPEIVRPILAMPPHGRDERSRLAL